MIGDNTLKILRKLSSDLVLVDMASPLEEWKSISREASELADNFRKDGDSEAEEIARLLSDVATSLSKGIVANPEAGVRAIRTLIGVLQDLDGGAGIIESHRKQAMAEGTLFFRDAQKEEELVKEATNFEDDDEQREMIMAIEQRIDELESDLLALDPPVTDSEEVRSIFRQFHTLKGEGAICGIKSVADFCHGIETEIEDARDGNLIITADIVSILQELTAIIRPILAGESREEIGEDLIEALMDELHEAVETSQASGGAAAQDSSAEEGGEDKFADFFSGFEPPPMQDDDADSDDDGDNDNDSGDIGDLEALSAIRKEESKDLAEHLSAADFLEAVFGDSDATQTEDETDESDSDDGGEDSEDEDDPLVAALSELSDTVAEAPDSVEPAAPAAAPAKSRKTEPDETVALEPPEPPKPARPRRKGEETVIESGEIVSASGTSILRNDRVTGAASTSVLKREVVEKKVEENKVKAISVDVHRLDDLLEIVGEVSLIGSYVNAHIQGQEQLSLHAANLLRACSRLQETANSMRMTSIRPLFMTVRRAAADAARASRKMIDINMSGIDTQVDRSIVESLSAALIHIIRNAVDHGIEPSDVRRRTGKPERGHITISALRTNSDIVIELGDDGKGFDLDAIHEKAVAMGKIAQEDTLTNEELADLVFLPGLSTAKKITGLSGRGVGMEIVRESIDSLRGKVDIRTAKGEGSTVRMRFPLMVAAMDAMMVRVGGNTLVVPVSQVRECFRATDADISTIEGRGTIVSIRGVILPVLFLGREFGIPSEVDRAEDGVLMVIETGEKLAAVLVDETLGSAQVVIRSLEGPLAQSDLVAGAAVLPDGSIGLVIETTKLTDKVATTASKAFEDAGKRQAESSRQIDTVSIGSNQVGMIDFNILAPGQDGKIRTHVFAINAFKTREFVPIQSLRSIPGSPPGFAGMMMLRQNTVPVVHMGVVLGLMSEHERKQEWEQIVLICEFSGKTVGFLVSSVERVSYISWEDIMPPPSTGGLIQIEYIVGTILMERLKGTLSGKEPSKDEADMSEAELKEKLAAGEVPSEAQVAFVLDFERIVGNVLELYGDMGAELGEVGAVTGDKKDGVRILLVEDSPLIRKQTNKALSAAGITVIEAGDGQEAWEIIEAFRKEAEEQSESIFTKVDLILSDIEMPRMDGYTLTYNVKHDPVLRVLPILLHSSITNDNMISRATEVEADGFIPKCDPKELADQLRKYLQ